MKSVYMPGIRRIAGVAVIAAALSAGTSARANVFASNIKLNGNLSSVTNASGTPVTISYILNEPASLGATIKILSGTNVVSTINVAAGNPGTLRGSNSVVWGGTNSGGANVPGGTYSLSITPASSGYTNWTQTTTDDTNGGTYAYWAAGIAVDCNTNSLYYGRIIVANSAPGLGTNFGDSNGIIKLNADASFADEGQGDAGGYSFAFDGYNGDIPRRGRIAADDRFYFNDWTGHGKIVAVDMLVTSNQVILDSSTFTSGATAGNWSEFDVVDVGTTNAKAYFADGQYPSDGVWVWSITNNGAQAPFDDGVQVIQADINGTPGTCIPLRSGYGLMIDESSNIFIGEYRSNTGDPTPRASCITNWPSSPNQPLYTNNIGWQVGQSDDTFLDVSDLAIDSRTNPRYVACSMSGGAGGVRILNAADGSLVTNIQQNANTYGLSVGWDNVGNVYAGNGAHFWRAYSPPGTNQATTVAVETIQVTAAPTPIVITSITPSVAIVGFNINFTAGTNDTPSTFKVYNSATVNPASSYAVNNSATVIQLSPGVFRASVLSSASRQFYRISR